MEREGRTSRDWPVADGGGLFFFEGAFWTDLFFSSDENEWKEHWRSEPACRSSFLVLNIPERRCLMLIPTEDLCFFSLEISSSRLISTSFFAKGFSERKWAKKSHKRESVLCLEGLSTSRDDSSALEGLKDEKKKGESGEPHRGGYNGH